MRTIYASSSVRGGHPLTSYMTYLIITIGCVVVSFFIFQLVMLSLYIHWGEGVGVPALYT